MEKMLRVLSALLVPFWICIAVLVVLYWHDGSPLTGNDAFVLVCGCATLAMIFAMDVAP